MNAKQCEHFNKLDCAKASLEAAMQDLREGEEWGAYSHARIAMEGIRRVLETATV